MKTECLVFFCWVKRPGYEETGGDENEKDLEKTHNFFLGSTLKAIQVTARDITARRRMEEELSSLLVACPNS